MPHRRTLSAILICAAGMLYGGYLIWCGITGNVLRGRFTGDPVIPPWMYISGRVVLAIISGLMMIILLRLYLL